ncbi:unnamed protein product [Urochloa humidicola]
MLLAAIVSSMLAAVLLSHLSAAAVLFSHRSAATVLCSLLTVVVLRLWCSLPVTHGYAQTMVQLVGETSNASSFQNLIGSTSTTFRLARGSEGHKMSIFHVRINNILQTGLHSIRLNKILSEGFHQYCLLRSYIVS